MGLLGLPVLEGNGARQSCQREFFIFPRFFETFLFLVFFVDLRVPKTSRNH
jgi:hypothetical protein